MVYFICSFLDIETMILGKAQNLAIQTAKAQLTLEFCKRLKYKRMTDLMHLNIKV